MRLKSVLAGILFFVALPADSHPLHLTFTNLEFNTRSKQWVLTIKVFSDDFATNLKMTTGTGILIDRKAKRSETDRVLKKWLDHRLMIWFDSTPVDFNNWKLHDIKVKEDATWITYTISAPVPGSEIKILNTLLFDLYPDMKNLFIVAMGQFQSAHEFKIKDQETVIKLNK